MEPLKKSLLAPYFDDIPEAELHGVELLDFIEAEKVWAENFDSRAKSLYDLPDDSWVIRATWTAVGTWIEAYNGLEDPSGVEDLLATHNNWTHDEPLLFVQNCRQIVALQKHGFLRCWQGLLAAFDDGPILMASRSVYGSTVFRFVPMGQILVAKRLRP